MRRFVPCECIGCWQERTTEARTNRLFHARAAYSFGPAIRALSSFSSAAGYTTEMPMSFFYSMEPVRPGYAELVAKLRRVYGCDFDSTRYAQHPIGQLLVEARECFDEADRLCYGARVLQLGMHVKHMDEIHAVNHAAYKRIRRQILNTISMDSFEAWRFEADIAASFARIPRRFQKAEAPDFTVELNSSSVGVECTSVHLALTGDSAVAEGDGRCTLRSNPRLVPSS